MRHRARVLLIVALSLSPAAAAAQILIQPTPAPTVTAENEPWFVSRSPVIFAGIVYLPAGPQVHFNQNEMVRTGFFGAIPVYTRTTIEPRSMIFIPLSGGLMQPYERRRSGPLAGTEGSMAPSFPVVNPAEEPASPYIQAPGPPAGTAALAGHYVPPAPDRRITEAARPDFVGPVVGTTGTVPPGRSRLTAARPEGLNAVFVEYASRRWYSDGQAVPFDSARFQQVGTYHELPVYAMAGRPETIFVPVGREASALVVPYSLAHGR
jgi:hypothetical protein